MHNRHNKRSRDCNRNREKVTMKNKLKIETAPAKRRRDDETRARLDVVTANKRNSARTQCKRDNKEKDVKHAIKAAATFLG